MLKRYLLIILLIPFFVYSQSNHEMKGKYFSKKKYEEKSLPEWSKVKDKLPFPIYEENELFVKCYWKAWELAFKNFYEPCNGSGFVSQFIDAAFNQNIFLWDTGFMTMFCNFAYGLVPGIESLDNFYCKQHETGEICREIDRKTGEDFKEWVNRENKPLFSRWGWDGQFKNEPVKYIGRDLPSPNPKLTLDAMNHPILAWAELESYKITGNKERLRLVYKPLKMYYLALKKYLMQGNGLFVTDWASMDNSPRNKYLKNGGTGIDISSEMVLFAENLLEIAKLHNYKSDYKIYLNDIKSISKQINLLCWDEESKFYYDLNLEGKRVPEKTIAAYWTLLAKVPDKNRANFLISYLNDPSKFGTNNPVPTCSKDEDGYDSTGGYWRGAIWAPTNTMVIRGLEKYGYDDLAREIAIKHLTLVAKVFENTGTIWENYEPENIAPGKINGKNVKSDFVGWSGLAPILYFIEYVLGIKANAPKNEILWEINSSQKIGCKNFRFNNQVLDLLCDREYNGKRHISVNAQSSLKLKVKYNKKLYEFSINKGTNIYQLD